MPHCLLPNSGLAQQLTPESKIRAWFWQVETDLESFKDAQLGHVSYAARENVHPRAGPALVIRMGCPEL